MVLILYISEVFAYHEPFQFLLQNICQKGQFYMNINPKTGKPWVNNYLQMYGTLFSNQKHKYIQLHKYYDLIGKIEGRTKAAYAMLLHSHIAQVTCNRSPGVHANIFMHIDTQKGHISNSKEMKEWMLKTGWMDCNGGHLLQIASQEVWWLVYKAMLDVGLISQRSGVLRAMVPIEGRFLPVPYAYVAFLSRIKRDSEMDNQIQKALSDVPKKVRANLENLPKEDLIDELVKLKTQDLSTSKNSEVFKMLREEISAKYPHQWGKNPEKKRENFAEKISEKISENFSENNLEKNPENNSEKNMENFSENIPGTNSAEKIVEKIPEKISEDISKKDVKPNVKELPIEDLHNFESNKSKRNRKASPKIQSEPQKIPDSVTDEDKLFFADEVTAHDVEKFRKNKSEKNVDDVSENFADLDDFDITGDTDSIPDLPQENFDIFGLPINNDDAPENVPELPESIEKEISDSMDEFWSLED